MHAALHAARGPGRSWSDVAYVAGYADQPHLTRELRALLGETPSAWKTRGSADSLPTERALADAFGVQWKEHGVLWHVIQFYQTGAALKRILRERDIDYTPYMYSTGLFDRAWSQYRKPVEDHWAPYVRGEITRVQAIERLVTAITAP